MTSETQPNENDPTKEQPATTEPPKTEPKMITISEEEYQANLDKLAGKVRKEEEAKRNKQLAEEAEKKRIAALEGEEKLKAEHAALLRAKDEEVLALKREAAIAGITATLNAAGLKNVGTLAASCYVAGDVDATDKNVKALIAEFTASIAEGVKAVVDRGAPPSGNGKAGVGSDVTDAIRRGAGIKSKK